MAKSFKKISVILFVVLLTALLIVGCALLANTGKVSQSENLENTEDIEVVADNVVSGNAVRLSGTSAQMAQGWSNAIIASSSTKEIIVTLGSDWTAAANNSGFGTGTGFYNGQLYIPIGKVITLDLNGKKLDRNMTNVAAADYGRVFFVGGVLNIKDGDNFFEYNKITSASVASTAAVGRITGANGSQYGGAIFLQDNGAKVNIYGGVLYNNKSTSWGGIIGFAGSSECNLYDGLIAYNTATGSGLIAGGDTRSRLNVYAFTIRDNVCPYGAVFVNRNLNFYLGAGAVIRGNKSADGVDRNVYLVEEQKIHCLGVLHERGKGFAQVGVTVVYGDKRTGIFADGFEQDASKSWTSAAYFYSDDATGYQVETGNRNCNMISGKSASWVSTWSWTGTQSGNTSTLHTIYLPQGTYTFTLSSTSTDEKANTFWELSQRGNEQVSSYTISQPGRYAFISYFVSINTTLNVVIGNSVATATMNKPTGTIAPQTYTGGQLTAANPTGFDFTKMNISGNVQTKAGTYTISVTPKANHVWQDGTTSAVTFSWKINKASVTRPTAGTYSYVYNGQTQTCANPSGFNNNIMTITGNTGINASIYTAKVALKDTANYKWSTGSEGGTVDFSWQITRKPIDRPTAGTNSFVYNTASQTYQGSGYNSSTMVLGGTSSATNVGTYSITIAPNSNHQWNSGTATETITFPWSITPKPLTKPTLSTEPGFSTPTYNGQTITVPTVGFDSNTMDITGNTGIDAGKKTAVITLKDTSNYKWADNTTGSVSLNWEIVKQEVTKPTQATQNVFVYDGNKKVYTPKGFDANKMILTDNEAIEANEYVAKVNLKPNYQWLGKTEEELTFKYTIVPPGLVVKEGVDYDFIYTDNGTWNQRYTYGESYQHKMNDQELNQVGGDNVYILGKVQPNTTIAQFLDNIDSDRDFIKIYNNFGELVFDGTANEVASTIQYIGTSYKVELYVTGESGLEILDEVYISILGDLNADGIVNSADMAMMRRLLNGDINLYSLPLERVLAVYLDNKGGLTSVDQELLNGLVAGRITSNELFEEQELLGEDEGYKYIDLVDGRRVQASTESAVLGNVTAGTSISEFVDKVAVFLSVGGASNITLYNNVGELVYKGIEGIQAGHSMQEYVGTGWKVKASNSETQYTVSVLGDVTGDGIINAMDVTYLRRIANDNKLLAELEASGNKAVLLAATISNRGGICTADSEILWGTICGTMDLSRYN